MKQTCKITGKPFDITDDDLKFYEKMGVPPPTLCPEERQRRRLAWRNERKLYHRVCDGSGKKIISIYSPEKKFPVYEAHYWWSDQYDGKKYGRDFDLKKSFSDQFQVLREIVPLPHRAVEEATSINSEFCNEIGSVKDCYLCFEAVYSEKCFYSGEIAKCFDCMDCLRLEKCASCYMCLNLTNCNNCTYIFDSKNCWDCSYCFDCVGCHDCFGCSNLRNKQYYFMNKELSKADFRVEVEKIRAQYSPWEIINLVNSQKNQFVKYSRSINTEDCTGDYLVNCKNCYCCFNCSDSRDCRYCDNLFPGAVNLNCTDVSYFGAGSQHCYECLSVGGCPGTGTNLQFSSNCWNVSDLDCCYLCVASTMNCFACIGLKNAQYCILNKQYSKEEYFALREKIIEHMKQTGEWGEFFPISLSPFAYNETVAQEYFPLTKEEALQKGYKWKDEEPGAKYDGPKVHIPETITETPDSICNQILTCETCTKNYRIVKPELAFYRKMNLPIPRNCPDCRHKARMALRNPRKLWKRNCDNCGVDIDTTFAPERPEKVFCEKCYLHSVS